MRASSLKDILFGLDKILINPAKAITNALKYALKKYIIEETYDNLLRFIGHPLVDFSMKTYGFDKAKADEAIVYHRDYFRVTGLHEVINEQLGVWIILS